MILKAKHHFLIYPFFKWYSIHKIDKTFENVKFTGEYKETGKPLLIISNHISWWDGFWIMYFNLKFPKRKFHFMMLENQLRKYWFFNYSGGFSINKNSKSIVESLKYSVELLSDSKNMVLIFPQGKINSIYENNLRFENGINRIISETKNKIQIIFVANLVDYFSKPKPGLFVYFDDYSETTNIEDDYNKFYKHSVEKQKLLEN